VVLARAAPKDVTIDQYHPDLEDPDPAGPGGIVVEQKLGSALFDELGAPSPVAPDSFFDVFPFSVLTTSMLDRLNELSPDSRFDQRRFRMNLIVDSDQPGFPENDWIGRVLEVGDGVRLRVAMPDPRCVMPTLAQDDLPKDINVLRTLSRHNRIDLPGGIGPSPCAGIYAVVDSGGTVRTGDRVVLT
jgi:uncharacterized protein YcbX